MFEALNGILSIFGILGSDESSTGISWSEGEWLAQIGRTAGWGGDFGDPTGLPIVRR